MVKMILKPSLTLIATVEIGVVLHSPRLGGLNHSVWLKLSHAFSKIKGFE
ncbi:hypothetical protein VIBNISFn118_150016 [Vibrio nigripulchritudo SFn118]|nr:hypothetical protein VIBNISFn118_150016 [Vibrio nigripulchritudo SFn118]